MARPRVDASARRGVRAHLGSEVDDARSARAAARLDAHQDRFEALLDGRDYLLGDELSPSPTSPRTRSSSTPSTRTPGDDYPIHEEMRRLLSVEGRPRVAAWIDRVAALPARTRRITCADERAAAVTLGRDRVRRGRGGALGDGRVDPPAARTVDRVGDDRLRRALVLVALHAAVRCRRARGGRRARLALRARRVVIGAGSSAIATILFTQAFVDGTTS